MVPKGCGEVAACDAPLELRPQPAEGEDTTAGTMTGRESCQGGDRRTIDRQGALQPQHDPPGAAAGDGSETLLELVCHAEEQVALGLEDCDRLTACFFVDWAFDQKSSGSPLQFGDSQQAGA